MKGVHFTTRTECKQLCLGDGPLHDAGVFAADCDNSRVPVEENYTSCLIAVSVVRMM